MNHQTSGRPHPYTRVEDVYRGRVLGVEAVQRGGSAHGCDGRLTHEHIQCGQSAQQIWLDARINAVPDAEQPTFAHLHVELLPGHHRQQLRGGGQAAIAVEKPSDVCVHVRSMGFVR